MRILVCGGRSFFDREQISRTLDTIHAATPITTVIHGAAPGADTLAGEWANTNRVGVIACPARWKVHGKAAGPIRNAEMLSYAPQLIVAFAGSRGTEDMIRRGENLSVPVKRIPLDSANPNKESA